MFLRTPHKRLPLFWWVLKATIRWELFYFKKGGDNVTLSWDSVGENAAEMFWPVDLDKSGKRSKLWKTDISVHKYLHLFFILLSCCIVESRPYHLIERLVSDLISLMNHGEAVGWTFSWAPSRLQKAPLTATSKHYAKEGKINTVRWGEGVGVGLGGDIALEQPLHVQWEWTFSHEIKQWWSSHV